MILIFLLGTSVMAVDTVYVEVFDTTMHDIWLPLSHPIQSADADGSGAVDIDDVVYLMEYIFANGPEPYTYWTVDLFIYKHKSYHVIIDTTGGEYDVQVFPHEYSRRFGEVSGQEWNDSIRVESFRLDTNYYEMIDTL